ncbi:MAG TPA: hypothetical protein VMU16_07880 [Candidatus Binataceae bacterium]|nr:hypothetical protein [Candidatus Binataceae bacterium]
MYEDESIDVACPRCGHMNPILVREFEQAAEVHFVCSGCKAGVKVEAEQFRKQLEAVEDELKKLEREAAADTRKTKRPRKDDFQI